MAVIKCWGPSILVAFLIFCLSALPGPTVDSLGLGRESYHINGHFLMFFLLAFTLFKSTKSIPFSILLGILYGVFDELHQVFVPGRGAGLFDVLVDSLGVCLAGVILWKFYHILPKKLRNWLAR